MLCSFSVDNLQTIGRRNMTASYLRRLHKDRTGKGKENTQTRTRWRSETWGSAWVPAWGGQTGARPTGGCRHWRWSRGPPSRTERPSARPGAAAAPIGTPHRPHSPSPSLVRSRSRTQLTTQKRPTDSKRSVRRMQPSWVFYIDIRLMFMSINYRNDLIIFLVNNIELYTEQYPYLNLKHLINYL